MFTVHKFYLLMLHNYSVTKKDHFKKSKKAQY